MATFQKRRLADIDAATVMPSIEIHGVTANGNGYVLNHFTADNAEVNAQTGKAQERAHIALRDRADTMVERWRDYLPDDRVFVVEVDPNAPRLVAPRGRRQGRK